MHQTTSRNRWGVDGTVSLPKTNLGNQKVYGNTYGWIIYSKVSKGNKKRTKSLFEFEKVHLFVIKPNVEGIL